jgi:glycosyltransferase involved in cell wall biosynthesis
MIFVFPSWDEGFPTVLAEAMDSGLPVVTTHIRGAADHLIPEQNALFVEPRQVEALSSAMLSLFRERDVRDRMTSANRERVRIFEPEVVATEYLSVLRISARIAQKGNPTHIGAVVAAASRAVARASSAWHRRRWGTDSSAGPS